MIYTATDDYYVILEVLPQYQRDPNALGLLNVKSLTGNLVPLNQLASLQTGVGPLTVAHYGQFPAVTLSFNLQPGVSLGQAVDSIEQVARESLPAGREFKKVVAGRKLWNFDKREWKTWQEAL